MQSSSSSSNNNTNNQEAATDKPSTSKQANNNNVAAQQQQRASSPSDSSSASSSSFDSLCNIGPEDGISMIPIFTFLLLEIESKRTNWTIFYQFFKISLGNFEKSIENCKIIESIELINVQNINCLLFSSFKGYFSLVSRQKNIFWT